MEHNINLSNMTIGTKIFVVHAGYAYKKKEGGIVNQARVVCFVNRNGVVVPEFRMIGQKGPNLSTTQYKVFTDIQAAINAIES